MRYSLFVFIFMLHSPAYAGDEDMNPTAYSVFDPVTGYMIPADQMPPQQHTQGTQVTNQTSDETTTTQSTTASQTMASQNTTSEDPDQSPMWMYLVAGALILGGLAAWVRNKGKVSSSNLD